MSTEVNFLHIVTVDSQMKIRIFGMSRHVVWWRGVGVRETPFATIRVEDEGIRLVSNDTSLPDYTVLHSARSSSSCTFLLTSNPSGSHKTMYRDKGYVVNLCNLEWHFDGAACKNKYIIFRFLMAVVKMMGIWTKLNHPKNGYPTGWTVQESNPSQDNIYSVIVQTGIEPHAASVQCVSGLCRRGVTLTTHLHQAPTLQKEYNYTFTPPLGLHGLF